MADDDTAYLVMRYVDGIDLSTLISRDGPLDPSRAAKIVDGVAGALDEAHAAGLVHRDVKPGNVLIASSRGRERAMPDRLRADEAGDRAGRGHGDRQLGRDDRLRLAGADPRPPPRRPLRRLRARLVMYCALTGSVPFERETDVPSSTRTPTTSRSRRARCARGSRPSSTKR